MPPSKGPRRFESFPRSPTYNTMHWTTKKTVGKMSIEKFHDKLVELEKKYKVIIIHLEMLGDRTVQVTIEYR